MDIKHTGITTMDLMRARLGALVDTVAKVHIDLPLAMEAVEEIKRKTKECQGDGGDGA